jgi:hypothetical protein
VTRGNIDAGTVLQALERCRGKQRSIIGFWCATTHAPTRPLRIRIDEKIGAFVQLAGGVERAFTAGDDDRLQMTIIGLGDVSSIVSGLPDNTA